jgi:hypothetical protein
MELSAFNFNNFANLPLIEKKYDSFIAPDTAEATSNSSQVLIASLIKGGGSLTVRNSFGLSMHPNLYGNDRSKERVKTSKKGLGFHKKEKFYPYNKPVVVHGIKQNLNTTR